MAFADSQGVRLFYTVEGPADAPALVLSNSMGTTHEMWKPQLAALAERFRVVRYDRRGHGQSGSPPA
jgi:pimeloyl-ACP methyl ester carboxylesterase